MKKYKISFLFLALMFPFFSLWAQSSSSIANQLIKSITHPSPQSAGYARYGEYPVDHSTGVPKIEIPLYTLNTGDYKLPISISYHASGIKALDISSPVGLGWTLNAGGVISRTVCGMPDYEGLGYEMFFKNKSDVAKRLWGAGAMNTHNWNRVFAGSPEYDYQSDRYSYNFAGKSGLFRYDVYSEKPFTIPHNPIKIERTTNGYKVTDTDGTIYHFESDERCWSPAMVDYVSAWYLTKIETANRKNIINFTYEKGDSYKIRYRSQYLHKGNIITYEQGVGQIYIPHESIGSYDGDISLQNYSYRVPMLKSITWNNVSIAFAYAKDRLDSQKERLTSITVNDGSTTVKHVTFNNNSYFGSTASNYRLKLNSLAIKGSTTGSIADNYSFTYNPIAPPNHYNNGYVMAADTYCCEDYWGYYNGMLNYHMIPTGIFPNQNMANRNASSESMAMCVLQTIKYPTGGTTTFELETNRIGNSYVGGLRVARIVNKDSDGSILEQKTYEYLSGNTSMDPTDDLFSYNDDFYYFIRQGNGAYQSIACPHEIAVASPILPLTGWSGSPVFYLDVAEYEGTQAANTGKTIYHFTQDFESSYPGAEEEDVPVPAPLRFYSALYNNDEGVVPALLTTKTAYKNNNGAYVKQLVEEYEYTELVPPHDSISVGIRLDRMGVGVIYYENDNFSSAPYSDQDSYYNSIVYTNVRGYRRLRSLTKVKTTDHERNVTTTHTYQYDSQLRCLKPTIESISNSGGDNYITKTYYPYQQTGSIFNSMTTNNYVDTPVKIEKYCNSTLLSTDQTTYKMIGNFFLPETIQQAIGNGSSRVLVNYEKYDNYGNPQYLTTLDNQKIVILWGYNSRYPVAKIEGMTYNDVVAKVGLSEISSIAATSSLSPERLIQIRGLLPDAQVTIYTYNPSVGVATEIAPNIYRQTYSYDALGRLSKIADDSGVKEIYQYNYKQ